MPNIYVTRKLAIFRNGEEAVISENELLTLGLPLVILGDPGMGKTSLTDSLAANLETSRVPAGRFVRSAKPELLLPQSGKPIIIDGLDELATSNGASAVDGVLTKLAAIGLPPFILSCRAADWNGSSDRQKILEDYGIQPITARLEPLERAEAAKILTQHENINAAEILNELDNRELSDFYKNPLTLNLLIEIVTTGQGLPSGRSALLWRGGRNGTSVNVARNSRNTALHSNLARLKLQLAARLDS